MEDLSVPRRVGHRKAPKSPTTRSGCPDIPKKEIFGKEIKKGDRLSLCSYFAMGSYPTTSVNLGLLQRPKLMFIIDPTQRSAVAMELTIPQLHTERPVRSTTSNESA